MERIFGQHLQICDSFCFAVSRNDCLLSLGYNWIMDFYKNYGWVNAQPVYLWMTFNRILFVINCHSIDCHSVDNRTVTQWKSWEVSREPVLVTNRHLQYISHPLVIYSEVIPTIIEMWREPDNRYKHLFISYEFLLVYKMNVLLFQSLFTVVFNHFLIIYLFCH